MTAPKLAEADEQIQTLRHHIFDECVAIASSIDTIPAAIVPRAMRWLQELRQATRAVALVKGRLVANAVRRRAPAPTKRRTR
jgi:hypothetical protein